MAETSIIFKIGSVFTGEGFKKAQNTVKNMNGEMKKAMEAANSVSSVLGYMDQSAGKATIAMTGMIQALMSMNATVIISQTAITALNLVIGKKAKALEEATKKAEDLKKSIDGAFGSALADRIKSVNTEVKTISSQFEDITKQANAFAAALEGIRNAEANGSVIQLQVEKLNALLETHCDEERQNVEATYNLKIAIQKSLNVEEEWAQKVTAATEARVENANRISNVDKQLAVVHENRLQLEEVMLTQKKSLDDKWKETQKSINLLIEKEESLEQEKTSLEDKGIILEKEIQKVKQEAKNAQDQAKVSVMEAELAEKRLTESKDARKVKEEAARDAADLKAAADNQDAQEVKTAAEIQAQANASAKKLEAAQAEYIQKLKAYNNGDIISDAVRNLFKNNRGLKNGILPVDVQKAISLKAADAKVEDAIRNGAITTVKDAQKERRIAMRESRDMISQQQAQRIREMQKYEKLKDMNPKALASSDIKFMQDYERIKQIQEERKRDLDEAKIKVEEEQLNVKKTAETLKIIEENMEKLGLK